MVVQRPVCPQGQNSTEYFYGMLAIKVISNKESKYFV